jgi:hypothetical protein
MLQSNIRKETRNDLLQQQQHQKQQTTTHTKNDKLFNTYSCSLLPLDFSSIMRRNIMHSVAGWLLSWTMSRSSYKTQHFPLFY